MSQRIFLTLRSMIYITGFMLFWLWLMPRWLNLNTSATLAAVAPVRWVGLIPLLLGAGLAISCFINFAAIGKGTPAPFDAPRKLVVSGLYRYVRNPMYLATGAFLLGCAILFAEFSKTLLWYGLGIVIAVNGFVLFYEEPTLRRKFDGDYEEYCRNVGRWLPRTQPWQPKGKQAVASAK
jgi:protein-S-isoprenylcysteine O-methyltransferase Ste14